MSYTLVLVISIVVNSLHPAMTTVEINGFNNQADCEKEGARLIKIHSHQNGTFAEKKATWSCSKTGG